MSGKETHRRAFYCTARIVCSCKKSKKKECPFEEVQDLFNWFIIFEKSQYCIAGHVLLCWSLLLMCACWFVPVVESQCGLESSVISRHHKLIFSF